MTEFMTARQIAPLFGLNFKTVLRWITGAPGDTYQKLKSHQLPGGTNRVLVKDLIKFTIHHGLPMPPEIDPTQSPLGTIITDYFFEKQTKKGEFHEPETDVEKKMLELLIDEGYVEEE